MVLSQIVILLIHKCIDDILLQVLLLLIKHLQPTWVAFITDFWFLSSLQLFEDIVKLSWIDLELAWLEFLWTFTFCILFLLFLFNQFI